MSWFYRRRNLTQIHPSQQDYFNYPISRYQYLDFKGMGVTDRVPLKLSLEKMYVPLRARAEMPGAETWDRGLRVAGRSLQGAKRELGFKLGEPIQVFDLLCNNKGLIILGDPGAGKTTFLKYISLQIARRAIKYSALDGYVPFLISISSYAKALDEQDISLNDFIKKYYKDLGASFNFDELVDETFLQGKALLLLDGLDEIRDISKRMYAVNKVINFFTISIMMGNRFVLTSRIVGYRDVRPVVEHLVECTLVDFDDDDMRQYIDRWILSLEQSTLGENVFSKQEAENQKEELLKVVDKNSEIY